jgi:hypothetical protein
LIAQLRIHSFSALASQSLDDVAFQIADRDDTNPLNIDNTFTFANVDDILNIRETISFVHDGQASLATLTKQGFKDGIESTLLLNSTIEAKVRRGTGRHTDHRNTTSCKRDVSAGAGALINERRCYRMHLKPCILSSDGNSRTVMYIDKTGEGAASN